MLKRCLSLKTQFWRHKQQLSCLSNRSIFKSHLSTASNVVVERGLQFCIGTFFGLPVSNYIKSIVGKIPNLKINDKIHGFVVENISDVEEYELKCFELSHEKTGAKHLHVYANDTNNLFRFF
jgi:hypothetical protein